MLLVCRATKDLILWSWRIFEIRRFGMKNCCGICKNCARTMTCRNIAFKSFFQAAHYDHITFTNYHIHRKALTAKKLAPELNDVLQDAVKIINFIKSHALYSRLFSNICKDTDSNYTTLLLLAEVRWLSRGWCLRRLLLLNNEIEIFLTERKCEFSAFFKMPYG